MSLLNLEPQPRRASRSVAGDSTNSRTTKLLPTATARNTGSSSNLARLERHQSTASSNSSSAGSGGGGKRAVSKAVAQDDSDEFSPMKLGVTAANPSFVGEPKANKRASDASATPPKWNFEKEDITLDDLKRLKKVFDEAAEAGGGQLSEEEFLAAFGPILAGSMDSEQLSMWFKHIDASDDGHVDWDEFSMFLLLSGDKDKEVNAAAGSEYDSQIFIKDPKTVSVHPTEASATSVSGYNHSETMTSIVPHPRLNKYYTSSQDGTVRVWDATTMEFESIMHNGKAWVTSTCLGRGESRLCIAGVDRVVSVYDVHSEKLMRSFVGNTTAVNKYTVARSRSVSRDEIDLRTLSYARARRRKKRGTAATKETEKEKAFLEQQERVRTQQMGPPTVDVHILREMDFPAMCMLSSRAQQDTVFLGLSNGTVQAYPMLANPTPDLLDCSFNLHIHEGPLTSLLWTNKDDGFVSTGSDGGIFSVNIEKAKATRLGEKALHPHPIHSSAWLDSSRLIATCGTERHVSLWSTGSQGPPILLKGHLCSVSCVATCDSENYLISIDVDKCLKIWDLRTLRPVQTTVDYDLYKPNNRMTCLTYDTKRNQLVTGCAAPVCWPLSKVLVAFPDPTYSGHQRSVFAVAFNPLFHKIATADAECIRLWAIDTGELLQTWTVDSLRATAVKTISDDEPNYIFEMIFDTKGKRLIVGLTSGTVLIANFANGQLLTEMVAMKTGSARREMSFAECTDLEHFVVGAKKYVAVLRGAELLIWEDSPDTALEKRLDWLLKVSLERNRYEQLKWDPDPDRKIKWRSPLPMCLCAMAPSHILVGTDCALILVYGTQSWDLFSILGIFEPSVNIMCLAYNERKEVIVSARSDGKIQIHSLAYKDRSGCLQLKDGVGRTPILQCIDIGDQGEMVTAADEEGYVYVCNIAHFDISAVASFDVVTAKIGQSTAGMECISYFQAHSTEILSLCVISWQGARYICTCSSDCQVRLFSVEGEFIGYCGNKDKWNLVRPLPMNMMRKLPAPVVPDRWSSIKAEDFYGRADGGSGSGIFGIDARHVEETGLDEEGSPTLASAGPVASTYFLSPEAIETPSFLGSSVASPPSRRTVPGTTSSSPPPSTLSAAGGGHRTAAVPSSTADAEQSRLPKISHRCPAPPKTKAQLIKESPRYCSPTRRDELLNAADGHDIRNPHHHTGIGLEAPDGSDLANVNVGTALIGDKQKGFAGGQKVRLRKPLPDHPRGVDFYVDGDASVMAETFKLPAVKGAAAPTRPSMMSASALAPYEPLHLSGSTHTPLGAVVSPMVPSLPLQQLSEIPRLSTSGNEQQPPFDPALRHQTGTSAIFAYRSLRTMAESNQPQTARSATPIETKVEMWKSGKAHYNAHGSWTARSLTKLDVPMPDDEVRKHLTTRKHKLPAHLSSKPGETEWEKSRRML